MLYRNISALVAYGLKTGLLFEEDRIYAVNLLLDLFHEEDYQEPEPAKEEPELLEILDNLLEEAAKRGILKENTVTERDLFDTRLMNCLMPRPSEVNRRFFELYRESPKAATDYFYKLSQDSDYIRRYRIKKDLKWETDTPYGPIEITVNLSKPEKDPKEIAAARNAKASGYPKCLLCMENVGYAGRQNHPARENHRVIPITIDGSEWGFQYSPYVYYNEHCIVLNGKHVPMKIERSTFKKLFDFIKLFPHYYLGSNADLPIVGGSILSHDHFQGGNYESPMARARVEQQYVIPGYEDVEAGILYWPLSVIRLRSEDENRLIDLGEHILKTWRTYTDEAAFILAYTGETPHNTITPIARKRDGKYELDLTLRNNITTKECPLGYYHPHNKLHHIKKENIGLIEVMGLAILPSRLKDELKLLEEYILQGKDVRANSVLEKHGDWVDELLLKYRFTPENIEAILQKEVGLVFLEVLCDAGVYKCTTEGRQNFERFIKCL